MDIAFRIRLLLVLTAYLVCDHCGDGRMKRGAETDISINNAVYNASREDMFKKRDISKRYRREQLCGRILIQPDPRRAVHDYDDNLNDTIDDDPDLDKILGGQFAVYGETPYMATVIYREQQMCGAAILSEFWVVSAAHCFYDGIATAYRIAVGDYRLWDQDTYEVLHNQDKIIVHEDYRSETWNYDIALVRIKPKKNGQGIQFTNYVQPICLAYATEIPSVGTQMKFSGWGDTNAFGADAVTLKIAYIPVIDYAQCKRIFPKAASSNIFCAGYINGHVELCSGDSGGPAVSKHGNYWILYGIASFSTGCWTTNGPAGFSSIPMYRGWIDSKIRAYSTGRQGLMPGRDPYREP